ncbi:YdcH family protein [Granulosicoccaceae sp. 1_MG-2023]|nr:YdcH family protein [Granulosicoccaceae sp. 1_MG-2023]
MSTPLNEEEMRNWASRLEEMRIEHRDLDTVIARMSEEPLHDQLQLRRLKKRKLWLKDQMTAIENLLMPDLDA